MKRFSREKANLVFLSTCFAILVAIVVVLNIVAIYWAGALEVALGFIGATGNAPYTSQYTDEQLKDKEIDFVTHMVEDGTVLLENKNAALPLGKGSKVTLFGVCSYSWVGTASYGSASNSGTAVSLKEALECVGYSVNGTAWNYYKNSGVTYTGTSYDLREIAWDDVNGDIAASYGNYSDAAILVFGRVGGEGADMPTGMAGYGGTADETESELSSTELGLIRGAKAAGFKKTIVIFNTAFAMEVNWQDIGVDAALVCPGTGNYGIYGLANVLVGAANPSGHLVDTYVYDNFSSPAAQNLSDTAYVRNGKTIIDGYVHYGEGVYVGYKYYETRYEDIVMQTANVGTYDYDKTVAYPFGYGLSYTTFEYEDYSVKCDGKEFTVSVTVKNTGSVAGKDAVGVYYQSPYTAYDVTNGIEKSAVNLVAFAKTGLIGGGKSEKVTLKFAVDDMKSYDSAKTNGYILEAGDYYVTAAPDAHTAVNNILSSKGYDRLVGTGDATFAYKYNVSADKKYTTDDKTGAKISNQFAFAKDDGIYLSRSDWKVMDGFDRTTRLGGISYSTATVVRDDQQIKGTREITEDVYQKLQRKGWERSERPENTKNNDEALFEQESELLMADTIGWAYDDPRWMELISKCKFAELHAMFNRAGYNTAAIESINKPATKDVDGPNGLASYVAGWTGFAFPAETTIAQTWDVSYAEEMGQLVAEDALRLGVSGWYAPGANIHRNPFGARNAEYYSEDPVMSGYLSAAAVKGAQTNGLVCYIKHFALNEHETNRNNYSSWATEQTIREVYLKPFEMAVKIADCHGVMTSMNKIGYIDSENSYALNTAVLRNEWGFQGAIITDYTSNADAEACLAAGVDLMLSTTAIRLSDTKPAYVRNEMKQSAKHVLYMVAQTNAMNIFLDGNKTYSAGVPVWQVIVISLDVVVALGVAVAEVFLVRAYKKSLVATKVLAE